MRLTDVTDAWILEGRERGQVGIAVMVFGFSRDFSATLEASIVVL